MCSPVKGACWGLAALIALMSAGAASATVAPKSPVENLVALYVPIQEALAGDSVAAVSEQAAKIAAEAAAAVKAGGDRESFAAVAAAAKGMTALDIDGVRAQLKPLSLALAHLFEKQPVLGYGIFYCPMADAYWLQAVGEVRNPYYGRRMTTCGTQVTKVED